MAIWLALLLAVGPARAAESKGARSGPDILPIGPGERVRSPDMHSSDEVQERVPESLDLAVETPRVVLDAPASELRPAEPLKIPFLGKTNRPLAKRMSELNGSLAFGGPDTAEMDTGRIMGRLRSLFDGLAVRKERDDPFEHVPPDDIRKLFEPWRLETQMKRIEQTPLAPEQPLYVAVFGDSEPGRFVWSRLLFSRHAFSNFRLFINTLFKRRWMLKKIVAEIEKSPALFAYCLGDFLSSGRWGNWRSFGRDWNSWNPKKIYLFGKGNHENRNPHAKKGDARFQHLLGSPRLAFDVGPVRFVAPDTSGAGLGKRQLRWLRTALVSDRFKLLFTHKPPAYLQEWTNYGPFKGSGGFRKGMAEFWRLVSRPDILSRYFGHLHFSAVTWRGNDRYRVSGGGGSPHYPAKDKDKYFEWILLKITPTGVEETTYRWIWDIGGRGRFVEASIAFIPKTTEVARADAIAARGARP